MIFKKLKFSLILTVAGMLVVPMLDTPARATDQDPLFPDAPFTKDHIKRGLALLAESDSDHKALISTGETKPKIVEYGMALKDHCSAEDFSGLCLGSGGSRIAIKVPQDSEKVVLLSTDEVFSKKEFQAYKIFNAFGFISQQDPELVTIKFQNKTLNNVLCVVGFDQLARKGTNRRTWDIKNCIGFGNISFFNGKTNYDDIDYHRRFLLPLVKDTALWYLMGKPSTNACDSLNLIFKKTQNTQTVCRLLIYDIYEKDRDVFEEFKNRCKNMSNQLQYIDHWAIDALIKPLYTKNIFEAVLPAEKVDLWGKTESSWGKGLYSRINETDVDLKWKQLAPLILEDFKKEATHISGLFEEVVSDLSEDARG